MAPWPQAACEAETMCSFSGPFLFGFTNEACRMVPTLHMPHQHKEQTMSTTSAKTSSLQIAHLLLPLSMQPTQVCIPVTPCKVHPLLQVCTLASLAHLDLQFAAQPRQVIHPLLRSLLGAGSSGKIYGQAGWALVAGTHLPHFAFIAKIAKEVIRCLKTFQANLLGDRIGLLQMRAGERVHDLAVLAACAGVDGFGCFQVPLPPLANHRVGADNAGGRLNCPCQLPLCIREVADVTLHLALWAHCCWWPAFTKSLPIEVFPTKLAEQDANAFCHKKFKSSTRAQSEARERYCPGSCNKWTHGMYSQQFWQMCRQLWSYQMSALAMQPSGVMLLRGLRALSIPISCNRIYKLCWQRACSVHIISQPPPEEQTEKVEQQERHPRHGERKRGPRRSRKTWKQSCARLQGITCSTHVSSLDIWHLILILDVRNVVRDAHLFPLDCCNSISWLQNFAIDVGGLILDVWCWNFDTWF